MELGYIESEAPFNAMKNMSVWETMRKALLTGVCISSLLWPYGSVAAEKKSDHRTKKKEAAKQKVVSKQKKTQKQSQPQQTTQNRKDNSQGDVPTLEERLSPAQVNKKIATIRQRIVCDGKISERDKAILLSVFDDVAQTQQGRWIFEKAHPDLNFGVRDMGSGCNGVYHHGSRTVDLGKMIFDQIANSKDKYEQIQKRLYLAHVIAQEATHSVQDTNKTDYAEGISVTERITIDKVCELHLIEMPVKTTSQKGMVGFWKKESV